MRKLLLALALLWPIAAGAVPPSTTMGDSNLTLTASSFRVYTSTVLTANRNISLPGAASSCVGQTCPATVLEFSDMANGLSTFSVSFVPASGDTINGSTDPFVVSGVGVRAILIPIRGNAWFAQVIANGSGASGGSSACVGCVGEFRGSTVISGFTSTGGAAQDGGRGGVVMATATAMNVTNVSIGPGDWECRGNVALNAAAGTAVTIFSAWTSSASAAAYVNGDNGSLVSLQTASINGPVWGLGLPPTRYNVAVATSVFLSARATFTTAAASAYGTLGCRRVR